MIHKSVQESEAAKHIQVGYEKSGTQETAPRPLSIAVFGPPGSGKTHVVKKIIQSAFHSTSGNFDQKCAFIEINMAQLSTPSDLVVSIEKATQDAKIRGQFLVIFFDEFDCKIGSEQLGWLRFFLRIMEQAGAPAVYVFAGGISHTYSEFSREGISVNERERVDFKMLKGPDFVSRLRGHINILGPNKVDETDDGFIIRRSITLRSMFEQALRSMGIVLSEGGPERSPFTDYVSEYIVSGMLDVGSYKHGARSMRALIDMCIRVGGEKEGKYVSSTLPTYSQLDMHLDSAALFAHMDRARFSTLSVDEREKG
jgi:Cdc6-like AAA superfamily ATPase